MRKIIVTFAVLVCMITASVPAYAVDVFFDGNGGEFNYYMDAVRYGDFFGDFADAGTKISDNPNAVLTDPVFFDPSRKFLGWMPNNIKDNGNGTFDYIPLASTPITSAAALNYVVPNDTLLFVAQWEGDDSDYFSEVTIDGFGGNITFYDYVDGPDMPGVDNIEKERWNYLKESKDSIKVQVSKDYVVKGDPVKGTASFEGWLELSVENAADGTKKYDLISDKLITTEEMMNRTVPSYDVVFVAKWSDVSMKSYLNYFDIKMDNAKGTQRVNISNGLQSVPAGVADKYASVSAIEKALAEEALKSNKDFDEDKSASVLMDVELQIKTAEGNWETVTYENFPSEGVEAVLPYPEGTDKGAFDFVVAHMISAGENAGTVEILKAVIEEDGIHVTFTSMSPVMIMYQEKGNGSTTDGAASPETGDTRLLWPALIPMFISGTALAILAFKRKESKR